MFELESQLVEKLVDDLQHKYGVKHIVKELRGGINIADIVCAKNIIRDVVLFDEYSNARHYFEKIYGRKIVSINKLKELTSTDYVKFNKFLHYISNQGYLEFNNQRILNVRKIEKATDTLVAIEAKLTDWRTGIVQAKRYKQYADKVYVAIPAELKSIVDIDLFKRENVGLILVSKKESKIYIKCRKEAPQNKDIKYYMEDKFIEKLSD